MAGSTIAAAGLVCLPLRLLSQCVAKTNTNTNVENCFRSLEDLHHIDGMIDTNKSDEYKTIMDSDDKLITEVEIESAPTIWPKSNDSKVSIEQSVQSDCIGNTAVVEHTTTNTVCVI